MRKLRSMQSKTLTGFDPVLVNGQLVLVAADGSVMLAQASQVAKVQSLPGSVAVGSNVSFNPDIEGAPLGITTLGGGGIDVLAKGDINVEKSQNFNLSRGRHQPHLDER